MPRISCYYNGIFECWNHSGDVVIEENLEMMIEHVEEEEIEIQVLLGDYLDDSDSVLVVPSVIHSINVSRFL